VAVSKNLFFLEKPFSSQTLAETVRKSLEAP
jgi:FixJ family two-component response regulator